MPEVIVIGAGISGLTAAHTLARAGKDVLVLEEAPSAGGKIVTTRVDGYLLESGPNSLRVENQETISLLRETGLEERVIEVNTSSKNRYVLKHGRWIRLPRSPIEAVTTPLLSVAGKMRVFGDFFIPKIRSEEESVASFVRRRLGKEILDYGADPFISGIYAGDPEKLSMLHAFPAMWKAEQNYGSLIMGMIKGRKRPSGNNVKPRVISFPEGLAELTTALRSHLGPRLLLHHGAASIEQLPHEYLIHASEKTFSAPTIIMTLPAYLAATMIQPFASDLASALSSVSYPPVAVVFLGYSKNQFTIVPEGFGGLIPSKERRSILGIIFSSSNFPYRAPEEHVLLTVLMGGATHPGIATWGETEIMDTAIAEVRELCKVNGNPAFQHTKVWNHAIPQYNIGYGTVLEAIDLAESQNPGLYFIGNYRGGISMGACIKHATELANRLV